jgi:hypothetical protein
VSGSGHGWEQFLADFYDTPNELRPGELEALDSWLVQARAAAVAVPRRPVVVPYRVDARTGYYAVSSDPGQARVLRSCLTAVVGPPFSDFDGVSIRDRPRHAVLDAAAVRFAGGDPSLVFAFDVPSSARTQVRAALTGMSDRLAAMPARSIALDVPIGRLVGSFSEACVTGRRRAAEVALQQLRSDHRVTARNRLFLEVEFLAAFEEWDRMAELVDSSDLLRLRRPTLVSDAVARFVVAARIPGRSVDDMRSVVASFGALVPATGSIRSQQGADYYGLWAVACGETVADVALRVEEAGWSADWIRATFHQPSPGGDAGQADSYAEARRAVEQGRLDAAVSMLLRLEPRPDMFADVVKLVVSVGSPSAVSLLSRYRDLIGVPADPAAPVPTADSAPGSLDEAFERLADPSIEAARREACRDWLIEHGPGRAVAGGLPSATERVRALLYRPGHGDLGPVIEAALDLATEIRRSAVRAGGFSAFGMAVLEMWAFSPGIEDRYRMERVIDLTVDVLAHGVSATEFTEVVEYLRACWGPFLTDADSLMGVDVIENLLNHSPSGPDPVVPFALPILSRLGAHNARRIGQTVFEVARRLASECGLGLHDVDWSAERESTGDVPAARLLIYSLMTTASTRAASILSARHPQLEIETCDDLVGSDRLRQQVRRSDLVVITDRAATHPATDAIRAELGERDPVYAMGRGSSSIIEAVEGALLALVSDDPS